MLSGQVFPQAQVVGPQVYPYPIDLKMQVVLKWFASSRDNRIIHLPPALAYHPCLEVLSLLYILEPGMISLNFSYRVFFVTVAPLKSSKYKKVNLD